MEIVDYPVWDGNDWVGVPLAAVGRYPLVMPNIAAVVWRDAYRRELLLQRRDKPGEPVRGCLELPMGRWHAGEAPLEALHREVMEETGLRVADAEIGAVTHRAHDRRPFVASHPIVVTVGTAGAYPALHVAYECFADGDPRPQRGETSDPFWCPVGEVRGLLATPAEFTGVAYAILRTLLA